MKTSNTDPTAGETARAIRREPGAPRRIGDPTDPRYERVPQEARASAGEELRVVDPTDPACGGPAA